MTGMRDIYLSCFNVKEGRKEVERDAVGRTNQTGLERNTGEFTEREKCRNVRVGINFHYIITFLFIHRKI